MDLLRFIAFEPDDGAQERTDEVESIAQTRLAGALQQRLRNGLDPGIDLKSARRAQAVRVKAEGGQIVIDEDDQGKVLSLVGEPETEDDEQQAGNLDDLFRPGSGVPEAVTKPDGSTQLVFRSIKASDIFGQQINNRRNERVERAIADVLQTGTVDAIEEGQREVALLYPELKKR